MRTVFLFIQLWTFASKFRNLNELRCWFYNLSSCSLSRFISVQSAWNIYWGARYNVHYQSNTEGKQGITMGKKKSETSGDWQNSFFLHQTPSSTSIIWESQLLFLSSKFKCCIRKIKQTHKTIQPLGKLSFQYWFITL